MTAYTKDFVVFQTAILHINTTEQICHQHSLNQEQNLH